MVRVAAEGLEGEAGEDHERDLDEDVDVGGRA
jgi:hypothetical protein